MVHLKPALSYELQVSRLKNYHKLEIKDIEKAQELLRTVNYYRLSGYGIGLKQKDNAELYKDMNKNSQNSANYLHQQHLKWEGESF